VEAQARVTSKGQVTIPAAVRRRLGIRAGSRLIFRVDDHDEVVVGDPERGERAHLESIPDFFDLAGSVTVPPELRGASWEAVRAAAWEEEAHRRAR
jgi:antitoxin PrlF